MKLSTLCFIASCTKGSGLKFRCWNKKGSSNKFPMSAASMSRLTMGGHLRLYLKNRSKIEFMNKRANKEICRVEKTSTLYPRQNYNSFLILDDTRSRGQFLCIRGHKFIKCIIMSVSEYFYLLLVSEEEFNVNVTLTIDMHAIAIEVTFF